jgi:hypothetical protein
METQHSALAEANAVRRLSLPDVCSADVVAEHLDLAPSTVRRALREGRLPGRRIGGRWFVARPALFAWLDSRADAGLAVRKIESHLRPVEES